MEIWVDADACPQVIKEILYRAAERAQVVTTLVANSSLRVPTSPFIRSVRVGKGFDVADHRIVQEVRPGDLVITADIPLAALVIARGARALDPRGELYTEGNVHERLAVRNLMQDLRAAGDLIAGPAPFSQNDRQRFANHLDHFLTRGRT
ncbi:MAG TPA: YaiI/YqxD family protein [Methylomirabilota bacterium]